MADFKDDHRAVWRPHWYRDSGDGSITEEKSSQTRVWDTSTLSWVKAASDSAGDIQVKVVSGGGGPVTVADGADTAEGATTDTAVTSDSNGTISGKLRGLVKIFASVWDSTLNALFVERVLPAVQTYTVPLGASGFNTTGFLTHGFAWATIQLQATGGAGLTSCTTSVSDDNTNWVTGVGPLNANSLTAQGSLASGSTVYVPCYGATYFRLNGNGDASFTTGLTITLGDGPTAQPLAAGGNALATAVYGLSGTNTVAIAAEVATTDHVGVGLTNALRVKSIPYYYNGTTLDRQRNNNLLSSLTGTLASAARTSTTTGSLFETYNWTKIRLTLNVTVASGTGGLQVQLLGQDLISAATYAMNTLPSAVVATGTFNYDFFPGAGTAVAGITQVTNTIIPRQCLIKVTHGDATSYTYSVSIEGLV